MPPDTGELEAQAQGVLATIDTGHKPDFDPLLAVLYPALLQKAKDRLARDPVLRGYATANDLVEDFLLDKHLYDRPEVFLKNPVNDAVPLWRRLCLYFKHYCNDRRSKRIPIVSGDIVGGLPAQPDRHDDLTYEDLERNIRQRMDAIRRTGKVLDRKRVPYVGCLLLQFRLDASTDDVFGEEFQRGDLSRVVFSLTELERLTACTAAEDSIIIGPTTSLSVRDAWLIRIRPLIANHQHVKGQDVAKLVGVSPDRWYQWIARARQMVGEHIQKEGWEVIPLRQPLETSATNP
jgi:hypothetical protein